MTPAPYEPIPDKTQVRADRLIGQRVDGYEVVEKLGEGGMGIVYRAHNFGGENQVALKILKNEIVANEETAKRIFEEARAVSSIGVSSIVGVLAQGKLPDGRYYLVTEFLEGEPLDWALRARTRFPIAEAIELIDELAAAVEAAHAWAIVHGNLKPSNIFLLKDPKTGPRLKLLDFGLAKQGFVSGRFVPGTSEVQVIGTPEFMAPEQARAEPMVPETDLYALGAVAFMVLTGRAVFLGKNASDVITQQLNAPPPKPSSLVPEVPESLDKLVGDLLQKDPKERPHKAAEVRQRLATLKQLLGPASPVSPAPATAPVKRPRGMMVAGAAVVLLIAAAGGAIALWPSAQEPTPVVEVPPPAVPPRPLEPVPVVVPPPVVPREHAPAPPQEHERERDPSHAVKQPVRAAPPPPAITERVRRLESRLLKKAAKDPDLERDGMKRLNQIRLRLTDSLSADERREIAKELDGWEATYLGK